MVLHGNGTTNTLLSTNGPVLLEGASTIDGRLVGASRDVEVVLTTIGGDASLVLGPAAGVVGAIRFNDIVLNKRVASPAIDSKIAIPTWAE